MNIVQNTPEWHEFRAQKIGASDACSIMGVGFKTPHELWRIKMGFEEQEENFAMKRGKAMEEPARQHFINQTGIEIFPEVVQHPEVEWMIASLDGISFDRKTIVEIKNPGKEDHYLAKMGIVPDKYYPQLQHQMVVMGLKTATYYSFRDGEGIAVKVEKDEKYIKKLLTKEREFYKCMMEFNPPEISDKDCVNQTGAVWAAVCDEFKECKKKLERLQAKEIQLKETLINLCKGKNSTGCGVRLTKVIRKGTVDYKIIPELEKVDLEKYRKTPIETWRLSC